MNNLFENWRKHLNEGAVPHSAHHVVKKMKKTGLSAKEALKSLTTDLSDEEAERWLERHKDEMDSATQTESYQMAGAGQYRGMGAAYNRDVEDEDCDKDEIEEVLGPDADVGDYIEDFKDSDAPQFKGKSKKKRREMAIAAALDAKDNK